MTCRWSTGSGKGPLCLHTELVVRNDGIALLGNSSDSQEAASSLMASCLRRCLDLDCDGCLRANEMLVRCSTLLFLCSRWQ